MLFILSPIYCLSSDSRSMGIVPEIENIAPCETNNAVLLYTEIMRFLYFLFINESAQISIPFSMIYCVTAITTRLWSYNVGHQSA